MNSGIGSSFRASSPNIAREVRIFIAVLAGRRRSLFTFFRLFETVAINNTTFWSFQANSSTLLFSERQPYSLPHSRATFQVFLSSRSLGSRPRFGSIDVRYTWVPLVASKSSRLIVEVRTVPIAPNPSSLSCINSRANVKRLSSHIIWKWSLTIPS